ncbi:Histidine kinase [Reichenbachiella faecimaris]|uniref:Histidine kinase n=1 Tax=Reichenbachiella faecimaris TaxID=692418 RepID=A0A1W2GGT0_REIFA|nr:histidine kinase [Reichenbachiella faecimaris]SMD35869.1 Histidine kinase [Reichenbachiella faecimaris]
MKFSWKLILYFGFAGVVASVFMTVLRFARKNFEGDIINVCGNFFLNAIQGYVLVVIVASIVLYVLGWIDRFLPWNRKAFLRFIADLVITPAIAMVIMLPLSTITFYIGMDYDHGSLKEHIIANMSITLVMDIIMVGIYEGYYFFTLWKKSLIKNEQLEKENMTARYEALKNQVNPHFLFNSLNTVSALIHEDPNKAEEFIDEFCKIYRFLLEHQDKNLHLLRDELTFVKSFLALQQVRFGQSLVSSVELDEDKLDDLIPTLSLQLLVENAIKHNQVTEEKPLSISITEENGMVVVKNTLQVRAEKLKSTGIGLNNLNARYEMLANLKPVFFKTESEYVAKLPLIQKA